MRTANTLISLGDAQADLRLRSAHVHKVSSRLPVADSKHKVSSRLPVVDSVAGCRFKT